MPELIDKQKVNNIENDKNVDDTRESLKIIN
jgi:hypothetical protein